MYREGEEEPDPTGETMRQTEKIQLVKQILNIRRIDATEEQIRMLGSRNLANWTPERIVGEIVRVVF